MGREGRWSRAAQLLLLALACFLTAWGALKWADRETATLPFWPAAGIALYGVRRLGLPSAALVGLALLPAFVLRDVPLAPSLVIAVGNALAAALAAFWMMTRLPAPGAGNLLLFGELLLAMAAASLIAALAGVAGATWWVPPGHTDALVRIGIGAFLGHYAGVVVLAPFLNAWLRAPRPDSRAMPLAAKLHLTAVLVATALLCGPLFFADGDWTPVRTWHIYPLMIWAALAFRLRGASAVMLIVAVAAVTGTMEHLGPFGPPTGPIWNAVLLAQQFIILTGLVLLLVAEVADERRALGPLRAARARFDFALDAAGMVGWEFSAESGRIRSFGNTSAFYGRQVETADDLSAAIHPEDREATLESAGRALTSGSYEMEYRVVLPSGEVRNVLARGRAVGAEIGAPMLSGIAIDVTSRRRDEERQALLMAELDHRVKNILATIQALISRTATDKTSVRELAETLKGRIQAMARAHSMLARNRWEGASLRGLLQDELDPYGHERVALLGPDVQLNPRAALSLSLILHELATNAAKYGALSRPEGKAAIGWAIETPAEGQTLVLEWIERGGPPIEAPPARRGFGSVMADRVVRHEFGGTIATDYAPEGLTVRVALPLDRIGQAGSASRKIEQLADPQAAAGERPVSLTGRRVLVVEDSPLIADMTVIFLQSAGVSVVGPFAGLRAATASVEAEPPEAALLDVNLGDEMVFPLADRLASLRIPFAFATGYGNDTMIPARFRDRPRLLKPFGEQALIAMTGRLLAR